MEVAKSVHDLEALENEERALAKESNDLVDATPEEALKAAYEKIRKLRGEQGDLLNKASAAAKDAAKGPEALKKMKEAQANLEAETRKALAELPQAAEKMLKGIKPETPKPA